MWWPTSLPQELAQSSVLNDDKVKNVMTYSPPPRAGPALWKMWWPTPLPQELAQPSVLNGDKVKNVMTYFPPPRTGPALCA